MIYAGPIKLHLKNENEIEGEYVGVGSESFYRIRNYDQMDPFFMTIVSDSDHWMFISSLGPLTAGRRNPENALFPYYTVDKIHDSIDLTGSKTIIQVRQEERYVIWEPFSNRYKGIYQIHRNLYKNVYGNKLLFEEINEDLGLTFRYLWTHSDQFGFIKKSTILNHSSTDVEVKLLDGIQNILPYGVDLKMQNERSNLLDAYKKNERVKESSLALYLLSSIPVDKAEPSESLKATTVWSAGLEDCKYLISSKQLDVFRSGDPVTDEIDIRASRGAYFLTSGLLLKAGEDKEWYVAGDLKKGPSEVAELLELTKDKTSIVEKLEADIIKCTDKLAKIVARSDGFQESQDIDASNRHFGNILFNLMRGGVFIDNYRIRKVDFLPFIEARNKNLFKKYSDLLNALSEEEEHKNILAAVVSKKDADLTRIVYEYLPLTFSRRHGDPSRPWNMFSIDVKDDDGSLTFNYQGNWRDIFQNWEALAISFPGFIESMIFKFLNASTADGYNPYRVVKNGFDWEVIEPDDPWSYIGYWGDHQIIYLLKLMELSESFHPEKLTGFLNQELFAFANVPYRIKPYDQILENPNDTIDFDIAMDSVIRQRMESAGMDGQLVWDDKDEVVHVNLAEKLIITLLAKLSNFIPEAGIWLNTQRPEWNDANNALVGNGVSMVTLYYIRRYLTFCKDLFSRGPDDLSISEETLQWLNDISAAFEKFIPGLSGSFTNEDRKSFTDEVGIAGSNYREKIYKRRKGNNESSVKSRRIIDFLDLSIRYADHSIKANKRDDELYHSYNLVHFKDGKAVIDRLYEMLEGQVSVLSSGFLSPKEANELLTALKKSSMYWPEQKSYLLYPDRELPRFLNKNNIPAKAVESSALLKKLIEKGNDDLIEKDVNGKYHFNGSIRNADSIREILTELKENGYSELIKADEHKVFDIFEQEFDHAAFTGRSGTFFGYEGLGSIYWHMVSKLLLATQENCFHAIDANADKETTRSLIDHYYDIRSGIGFNKSPEEYGAFPSDAYSHTPGSGGAKQPGMTGQVKEDILSRFGEMGVRIRNGEIHFEPYLLKSEEFLKEVGSFEFYDLSLEKRSISLKKDQLAFTFNQVPVILTNSGDHKIIVHKKGGEQHVEGNRLAKNISSEVFDRSDEIEKIEVFLSPQTD